MGVAMKIFILGLFVLSSSAFPATVSCDGKDLSIKIDDKGEDDILMSVNGVYTHYVEKEDTFDLSYEGTFSSGKIQIVKVVVDGDDSNAEITRASGDLEVSVSCKQQ